MSGRSVNPAPDEQPRRAYHSPERERRALETRARIVNAARSLFLANGYLPTTMRAIASEAGVAEKTVYLVFTSKPALLDAVIDASIGGGGEPPRWAGQQHRSNTQREILHAFCEDTAGVMERTARVLAIAEAAANIDPDLAQLREHGHDAMRARFAAIAAALNEHGALAPGMSEREAAATVYALANAAVYLRLIDGYHWSPEEYGRWLERVLSLVLLGNAANAQPDKQQPH